MKKFTGKGESKYLQVTRSNHLWRTKTHLNAFILCFLSRLNVSKLGTDKFDSRAVYPWRVHSPSDCLKCKSISPPPDGARERTYLLATMSFEHLYNLQCDARWIKQPSLVVEAYLLNLRFSKVHTGDEIRWEDTRGSNVTLPLQQRHRQKYRGWYINITVTEQITFKHPRIITGWKMRNNEGLSILSIGKLTGFSERKKSRRKTLRHQMQTSIYAGSRSPGNHISDQECQHWSARSKDTDEANLIPQTTTSLPSYSTTTILFISATWQIRPSPSVSSIFKTAEMWTCVQQISFSTTAINSQNRTPGHNWNVASTNLCQCTLPIWKQDHRCWLFFKCWFVLFKLLCGQSEEQYSQLRKLVNLLILCGWKTITHPI